jgi:uncharacterized protein YlxW (UPF0749 family)
VKTTTLLLFEKEEIKETEIPYPNVQNLSAKEEEELQKKIEDLNTVIQDYEDSLNQLNTSITEYENSLYDMFAN